MPRDPSSPLRRVAGIVLAAGSSSRFGTAKALLHFDGEPLAHRVARRVLAAGLNESLIVLGDHAEAIADSLRDLAIRTVLNPDHHRGQSSSVAAGVRALGAAIDAAIFVPCDQPHIEARLLLDLVAAYTESSRSIVVPTFAGRRGAPVLIDRCLFPELLALEGDQGARQIFARHADRILELPLASGLSLADIDTREEFERLSASLGPPLPD